jgi:hypothetical protein
MLDSFTITDATTRNELIDRINDLDEEILKMDIVIGSQEQEIASMSLSPVQLGRLAYAADIFVDQGIIHNIPATKLNWIEGR